MADEIHDNYERNDKVVIEGYLKSKLKQPQMLPERKYPDMVLELIVQKILPVPSNGEKSPPTKTISVTEKNPHESISDDEFNAMLSKNTKKTTKKTIKRKRSK